MNRRNRRRRKGKTNKIKWAVGVFLTMLLLCAILYMTAHFLYGIKEILQRKY